MKKLEELKPWQLRTRIQSLSETLDVARSDASKLKPESFATQEEYTAKLSEYNSEISRLRKERDIYQEELHKRGLSED